MLLDHVIMTFVMGFIVFLLFGVGYLIFGNPNEFKMPEWFVSLPILLGVLVFSIYFNKDAIKGRSPAKRMLGFIIIDNKTGKIANPIQSVIRNLTIILWPIEVIFSIFSPQRRMGDFIAGTKVIDDNKTLETELKTGQIIIAIIIGILFLLLIFSSQLFIGFDSFDQ